MKIPSALLMTLLAIVGTASAFQPCINQSIIHHLPKTTTSTTTSTTLYEYIPSGFTKESYAKFKKEEQRKKQKKNLGRMGPKGFKSRSFQSFQEALERGEAAHLMPVMNAKEKVAKGELRKEDIPYMQRGGSWDNTDIRGAKRKRWLESDKDYASGGYKKEQSISIFGVGGGLDWTGTKDRTGPYENSKGSNNNSGGDKPKKKFFGLF